jgi:hypothetical protein
MRRSDVLYLWAAWLILLRNCVPFAGRGLRCTLRVMRRASPGVIVMSHRRVSVVRERRRMLYA